MIKLLLAVAVLGGATWAATSVPVGDRTVWEHGRALVDWDAISKTGGELRETATEAVKKELAGREKKPAKPARTVAQADRAPAEELTEEDREALEKLLPH